MSMASLGWAAWWLTLVLRRFAPDFAPHWAVTEWVSGAFAGVGLLAAFWCFRAKLAWLLITGIAVFANGSLFVMPWIVEVVRNERAAARASTARPVDELPRPVTPADGRPRGS